MQEWVIFGLTPAVTIVLCLLMKWFMTVFALSLPTPTGVVAPTMIIGALLGRVYAFWIPDELREYVLQPGNMTEVVTDEMRNEFAARLAIVGAAAFCASVTRAFAMAITVFEVLALPNSVLPLSLASLIAIFTANLLDVPGFFDQILKNKGVLGVPALTSLKFGSWPVTKVMRPLDSHSECLPTYASLADINRFLLLPSSLTADIFPIVHHLRGGSDCLLMGTVSRQALKNIVAQRSGQGQRFEGDLVVNFMEPMQYQSHESQDDTRELVDRMPLVVHHLMPVKDVYLLLKVRWDVHHVFVTQHGKLLGVITGQELLGRDS